MEGENNNEIDDIAQLRVQWKNSLPSPLENVDGVEIPNHLINDAVETCRSFQEFTKAIFNLKSTQIIDKPTQKDLARTFRDELDSLLESSSDENEPLRD